MKTNTEYLMFNTSEWVEFINITEEINAIISKSGVDNGMVLINPMHITAAVYVNDAESGLIPDYKELLKRLVPEHLSDDFYWHNLTGEDNAYAYLWRTIMDHQVTMAITNGELDLGTWEQIYYANLTVNEIKGFLLK